MNYLYLFEGETERKLLETLKRNKLISGGKLQKFNLWDDGFSKIKRLIPTSAVICIVFDTDVNKNYDRFSSNLKGIINCAKKVILLAQHKNLEDELVYSCRKNSNVDLYLGFYGTKSCASFKNNFLKDKDILLTLNNNGFQSNRIWCRDHFFVRNKIKFGPKTKDFIGSKFILQKTTLPRS